MALKPTIYKTKIQLTDNDRHIYTELNMTLALHPSETPERMIARLLALCLEYEEGLEFSRGLSTPEEPSIWRHADNGTVQQWIEMGHPEASRLKKALGKSLGVSVYCYAKSTNIWWTQNCETMARLDNINIFQFIWDDIKMLAGWLQRNLSLSVNVSGDQLYISDNQRVHTMQIIRLQHANDH